MSKTGRKIASSMSKYVLIAWGKGDKDIETIAKQFGITRSQAIEMIVSHLNEG